MSKGPWNDATRKSHAIPTRVDHQVELLSAKKNAFTNEGYAPRAEVVLALQKQIAEIGEGSADEWIRATLTVEVKRFW